ncbi:MAG: Asp-tRNA(Asn)/Glu-tRNA(Gln) amidotransferase subunit GatA [Candidatus Lambdaproteobacteria bacterium]|nr:Asp-tRNA(Asn)/Glu-tRNA(Gln) amidotransferase subunit GatA [Candidatus Lambdaproteobacteria bacterium]
MELCESPIRELHRRRLAREISTAEIARSVLGRIERYETRVRAYITLTTGDVLSGAEAADAKLARGEPVGPIEGMPLALKDIFITAGIETTCGSRILKGFKPPYDATVVERLKAHGLNLLGKTNLDEFAMGSSTESSAYGPTRNPWAFDRVPGGSSGGSAAAVAAGEALAALGTDTGGSIRQPAAFTSLVGLKPTYGRVSRYGMIAYASSLDQGGPITRDIGDAALLLNVISGHDPRDSTSARRPVPDFTRYLQGDLQGVRVGLVREIGQAGQLDPEVGLALQANLETLRALGAEPVEISMPSIEYAVAVYYILAPCEASSNLGRYDGIRLGPRAAGASDLRELYRKTRQQGFGAEVKRRIMLGTFALSAGYYDAYYVRAMKIRELLREDFRRAFARVELIAGPTSPIPAFRLGEKLDDPLQMYLTDAYTLPANLAGLPAVSIPGGFTRAGLPLGLQLMADHFREDRLIQAAWAFEQATDHHRRRPALS